MAICAKFRKWLWGDLLWMPRSCIWHRLNMMTLFSCHKKITMGRNSQIAIRQTIAGLVWVDRQAAPRKVKPKRLNITFKNKRWRRAVICNCKITISQWNNIWFWWNLVQWSRLRHQREIYGNDKIEKNFKCKMEDSHHIENRFLVISLQHIFFWLATTCVHCVAEIELVM